MEIDGKKKSECMMISVIVPVYNSEKFLERCLDSILDQDFKDFEVLIINDGSTDSSPEICDRYADSDGRMKVFHTRNKGVADARQKGIENACGKYLLFVDSDDWLEKNMFGLLVGIAETESSDIVAFNFVIEGDAGNDNKSDNVFLTKTDYLHDIIANRWGVMWRHMIKRGLVEQHDICFPKGYTAGEDYIFIVECLLCTGNFTYVAERLYHYNCLNSNSISSVKKITTAESHMLATDLTVNLLEAKHLIDVYRYDIILRKLYVKNMYFYFGIDKWYGCYPEVWKSLWNPKVDIPFVRRLAYSLLTVAGAVIKALKS